MYFLVFKNEKIIFMAFSFWLISITELPHLDRHSFILKYFSFNSLFTISIELLFLDFSGILFEIKIWKVFEEDFFVKLILFMYLI